MKIKHLKFLLNLLFSLSFVFSSCSGGSQQDVAKLRIEFKASDMICKKGYLGNGEEIGPNTEIIESYDYQFKAKLKTMEKVKHWLINGKAKTYQTKETFSYTVNKDDIDTNDNTITISFEKQ